MSKKLTVGIVLKPQGICGEIKVKPLTDFDDDILHYKEVYIGDVAYKVVGGRLSAGFVFLALKGIADRNAAELLRGKEILIDRTNALPLDEGRYYIVDVIGCSLFAGEEKIGIITDILSGSTDIYTVEADGKKLMFPLAPDLDMQIDIDAKTMTVDKKRFAEIAVYED